MDKKYIYGILAVLAVILAVFFLSGCETKFTEEQVRESIVNAVEDATKDMYTTEQLKTAEDNAKAGLYTEEQIKNAEETAREGLFNSDELNNKIQEALDLREGQEQEEEEKLANVYTIDEIEIGGTVSKVLSDRQVSLFDGKIPFDGDDYDAEEVLKLSGLIQKANGNDFKENTYLQIPVYSLEYVFSVENSFDTSKIGVDDETLEISLLGKEVEISEWIKGKITLTSGTEYLFEEGETKEIEDQVITVVTISDATGKVLVKVGVESQVMLEGETESFNDLDIYVKEVLSNEAGEASPDIVTLKIGKDIETVIEDGEYDEDNDYNVWEWVITEKEIKLTNAEEFMYLDEDDTEFNVLGAGENLCLPNDYDCVEYNGLEEESTETYKFDLHTKGATEYIRVKGNFVVGLNDFDKIYIDPAKPTIIYDKELNVLTGAIELGDTEMELVLFTKWGNFVVFKSDDFSNEFSVKYDLNSVYAGATDISANDDNYRTLYGIVIENPEDSCEDQEFTIVVPEEQLYGSITVY